MLFTLWKLRFVIVLVTFQTDNLLSPIHGLPWPSSLIWAFRINPTWIMEFECSQHSLRKCATSTTRSALLDEIDASATDEVFLWFYFWAAGRKRSQHRFAHSLEPMWKEPICNLYVQHIGSHIGLTYMDIYSFGRFPILYAPICTYRWHICTYMHPITYMHL